MSKRERNRKAVVVALRAYGPMTYHDLSRRAGLSHAAAGRAVMDLSQEDGLVVGLPCYANDYTVSLGWANPARRGEGSQSRHNATRLERQAVRFENAAGETSDPSEAAILKVMANNAKTQAANERILADTFK